MLGHADETDDLEPVTESHPGCSVVPAALAMAAEREGNLGEEFLGAVVLKHVLSKHPNEPKLLAVIDLSV
jgi:hypothetical protein